MKKELFFFNSSTLITLLYNKSIFYCLPTKYLIRNFFFKTSNKVLVIIDTFKFFFIFKIIKKKKKKLLIIEKNNMEQPIISDSIKIIFNKKKKKIENFVNLNLPTKLNLVGSFISLTPKHYYSSLFLNKFQYFSSFAFFKKISLWAILYKIQILKQASFRKLFISKITCKKGYVTYYPGYINGLLISLKKKTVAHLKIPKKIFNPNSRSYYFLLLMPFSKKKYLKIMKHIVLNVKELLFFRVSHRQTFFLRFRNRAFTLDKNRKKFKRRLDFALTQNLYIEPKRERAKKVKNSVISKSV